MDEVWLWWFLLSVNEECKLVDWCVDFFFWCFLNGW